MCNLLDGNPLLMKRQKVVLLLRIETQATWAFPDRRCLIFDLFPARDVESARTALKWSDSPLNNKCENFFMFFGSCSGTSVDKFTVIILRGCDAQVSALKAVTHQSAAKSCKTTR